VATLPIRAAHSQVSAFTLSQSADRTASRSFTAFVHTSLRTYE
jgi:hypothetical protein